MSSNSSSKKNGLWDELASLRGGRVNESAENNERPPISPLSWLKEGAPSKYSQPEDFWGKFWDYFLMSIPFVVGGLIAFAFAVSGRVGALFSMGIWSLLVPGLWFGMLTAAIVAFSHGHAARGFLAVLLMVAYSLVVWVGLGLMG